MRALLVWLVRLYPRPFRDEFGDDVREQLVRDYDRARAQGRLAGAWCALACATDIVRSAIAERVNPTWTTTRHGRGEQGEMRWTGDWMRDLTYAVRALRRAPAFTAIAVGTLALAIGANAAMFGLVDAVLVRPLPYAHADRLVHISATAPGTDLPAEFGASDEFYLAYRESPLIEDLGTYNSFTATLRVNDRAERIHMSGPTYSVFTTLGARPELGRLPNADDDDKVVVISDELWTSWFARDSSVIGKSFEISGANRTVIGVLPPSFQFPADGTLLWFPTVVRPGAVVPGRFGDDLVARIKPGVTMEQLATALTSMSKSFPRRFGGSASYANVMARHHAIVRSLRDETLGSVAGPLWVLLGAVAIVLAIACVNVSNLFIVRAESRQRDLAVRRAIGATRGRLVRTQMSEAICVAAAAGVFAAFIARIGLPMFVRAAPTGIPRLATVKFDTATLVFTFIAAIVASLVCGLVPAIRASSPDLTRLRDGGRGSTRRQMWTRGALVAAQTALALVLLIGSGLLIRSFWAVRHVSPGYSTEDLFTFQIAPTGPHLTDGPSYARFDLDFIKRLAALPGVETVGLVDNIPLDEETAVLPFRTEEMGADPDAPVRVHFTFTAGEYFKAMGIKLLRGRFLTDDDHLGGRQNILISKAAANALWPGKDPIGRRVQLQGETWWVTVVGVVDDVLQDDFRGQGQPLIYLPLVGPKPATWAVTSPAYVVKTKRAEVIAPEVRAIVHQIAPGAPMYRVYTMAFLARRSTIQLSFTMLALGIVSTLALILGAVGLYGVLSYVVTQRTREIGVRLALGAESGRVRRMVVAQGARVVGAGVIAGIVVAVLSTKALGKLLFDVKALDAVTFAGMSLSMLAVGLLASYVPARRASRVAPIEALRGE
jgi:predicted permease